jgi:superfamily II DNA or RNA helicase
MPSSLTMWPRKPGTEAVCVLYSQTGRGIVRPCWPSWQTVGSRPPLLTGDLPNGERQAVVEAVNTGGVKVLVATGQLIGEGFDCKALSTLFLATPIRFDGRLLQYLGRVLRPAPGKDKAKVYDYVDEEVGVLKAAAEARRRVYAVQG